MDDGTEVVTQLEPTKEKLWTKKNIFLLLSMAYANFTLGTCYSLPAPFFPHEAEKKGASPTVYGLVFGVFQLVNLIMSPLWGKLMPHLIPRFILVSGIFVAGSSSVLFGLLEYCPAGWKYITLAFLVRIVESVGVTAYITTCYGLLPVFFPGHVATTISTMETLFGFGMIAGPTVGGALYQLGGYYLPFITLGTCLVLGSSFTWISFSARDEPAQEKTGDIRQMINSMPFIVDMLVFGLGFVCIGFNDATLEPHLRQFNLKPAILGLVFIIVGGIYAFTAPGFGYLIDKGVNAHYICIFGCALCLVSFLIIGPVPFMPFQTSFPVIIVALVLQGFGIGAKGLSAFMHAMRDILARGFPDSVSTYALFTGIMTATSAVGAFAGPSLGGFLLDHVGYANGTLVIVGLESLLIIMIVVFRIYDATHKRKSPILAIVDSPELNDDSSEVTPLIHGNKV